MSRLSIQQAIHIGLQHHNAGQLQQAETIYRQILQRQPNQPDALHLLGVIAHQVGRADAAVDLIGRAVSAGLRTAAVYNNLGEAHRALGQDERAVEYYRTAIKIDRNFAGAHSNLGIVLAKLGPIDEAEAEYRRAIQLDPKSPEPYSNLGNLLVDQGKLDEAAACQRRAVALRPDYVEGHHNLGAALEKQGDLSGAENRYRYAIELRPNFAEAMNNLGAVLQKQGKLAEALTWWEKTAQAQPQFADAHWNIGLTNLAMGNYSRGWQGYEWRWRCKHSAHYWLEYPGKARWDGSPLNGKTILLFPEQGFGDVIQFGRFVPRVTELGGRVILECQPELIDVMKTLDGVAEVIPLHSEPPAFDTFQALLSLPLVLGITLENLPAQVPYLHTDATRREHWRARISAPAGALKVGIVWSGRPIPDPKRSMQLKQLAPLWDVAGVAWFSLQTGDGASQLADAPAGLITDLGRDFHDFADTAAAIANLDLILTIDTAAAHLAGAMGARTWTTVPFAPDWRWMLDRANNPWYPTMRIFRQPRINDWETVVQQVRQELLLFRGEGVSPSHSRL